MAPRAARKTGPTEMDRLDPQPAQKAPPRRRAPAKPKAGPNETAVLHDLAMLPEDLRRGGIAAVAITLARALDVGDMSPRDTAAMAAQLRMSLTTLREIAPGEAKGDHTDEVRERRERRLAQQG